MKDSRNSRSEQSVLQEPTRKAMKLTNFRDDCTDPMGSYTGRPEEPNEIPVQDADDL